MGVKCIYLNEEIASSVDPRSFSVVISSMVGDMVDSILFYFRLCVMLLTFASVASNELFSKKVRARGLE